MKNYLLGCDWGTSSFRLRLIDSADLRLIGEVTSQESKQRKPARFQRPLFSSAIDASDRSSGQ